MGWKTSLVGLCVVVCVAVSGCSGPSSPDPTVPPIAPSHQIAGSLLPQKAAGYTVLGDKPTSGDIQATYARDVQPLDLAVVSFDATGEFGTADLRDQTWVGASRCGILWEADTSERTQVACVTVLTDGVMLTVSGGEQTPVELAELANTIYVELA